MKKLALILALTLLAAFGAAAETFTVGMECNYAPYNWTQTSPSDSAVPLARGGYADGYDVQIAKRIAQGLGMDLVIMPIEWDGLPVAVQSGTVDAIIAGMSPTAERKLTIDFTDVYYRSDLVVVVRKDGPYAGAKTLKDLSGARITGQLNTFHYNVIDQIPGVQKLTAMESFPVMTVALSAGGIDGYISEKPGALSAVLSNPDLSFVEFEEGQGFEAAPEDTDIAVGLKKGSPLLSAINQVLSGISEEEREQIMLEALNNQPLSN